MMHEPTRWVTGCNTDLPEIQEEGSEKCGINNVSEMETTERQWVAALRQYAALSAIRATLLTRHIIHDTKAGAE